MSLRMIYDLIKWYKRRKKGAGEAQPPTSIKAAFNTLGKYSRALEPKLGNYPPISPYLYLIDPDLRPEEKEFIKEAMEKTGWGAPLAARLAVKADVPKKRTFASIFGPLLEIICFLSGIEHEDEVLRRPDLIKEALKLARAFLEGKPYIYQGIVIPPDWKKIIETVAPIEVESRLYKFLSKEDIELWEKWFEDFYKKHPELLEEAKKAEEAEEAAAVEAVQLPLSPRVVMAVERWLANIEAAQDFLGGVPLEYVRAFHRELEGCSDLLRKALLHLETYWARGDFRPLEGLEHLRGLPEERLGEHGLAGDLEYFRQRLEGGEFTVDDVRSILHTLHSMYTLSAKLVEDFLRRPEQEILLRGGEPATGTVRLGERVVETPLLRPEAFKEYVAGPMRGVWENAKVIVLHKP